MTPASGGSCVRARPALFAGLLFLAACAEETVPTDPDVFAPSYSPVVTTLLADDLVSFTVSMSGARGPGDLRDFTDCAAAQYAVIRGLGFARHVRTNLGEPGLVWGAEAAYTISRELPRGTQTLDAAATLEACRARGIATI